MKKHFLLTLLTCITGAVLATSSPTPTELLKTPALQGYFSRFGGDVQSTSEGTQRNVTDDKYSWMHPEYVIGESGFYEKDTSSRNHTVSLPEPTEGTQQISYTFWANPVHDMIIGLQKGNYCLEFVLGGWDSSNNAYYWNNKDQRCAVAISRINRTEANAQVSTGKEWVGYWDYKLVDTTITTNTTLTTLTQKEFLESRLLEPRGGTALFTLTILQSVSTPSQWAFSLASKTQGPSELTTLITITSDEIASLSSEFSAELSKGLPFESIGFRCFAGSTTPYDYTVGPELLLSPAQLSTAIAQQSCEKALEHISFTQGLIEELIQKGATEKAQTKSSELAALATTLTQKKEALVAQTAFTSLEQIAARETEANATAQEARQASIHAASSTHDALTTLLSLADEGAQTLISNGFSEDIRIDPITGTQGLITRLANATADLQKIHASFPAPEALAGAFVLGSYEQQQAINTFFTTTTESIAPAVLTVFDKTVTTTTSPNTDTETVDIFIEPDLSTVSEHNVTTFDFAWLASGTTPNYTKSITAPASGPQQLAYTFWANPIHDLIIGLKFGNYCLEFVVGGWDTENNKRNNNNNDQSGAFTIYDMTNNSLGQIQRQEGYRDWKLPLPRGGTMQYTLTAVQSPSDPGAWTFALSYLDATTKESQTIFVMDQSPFIQRFKDALKEKTPLSSIAFRVFSYGIKPYEFTVSNSVVTAPAHNAITNAATSSKNADSLYKTAQQILASQTSFLSMIPGTIAITQPYGDTSLSVSSTSTELTLLANAAAKAATTLASLKNTLPSEQQTYNDKTEIDAVIAAANTISQETTHVGLTMAAHAHKACFMTLSLLAYAAEKLTKPDATTAITTLQSALKQATAPVSTLIAAFPHSLSDQKAAAGLSSEINAALATYLATITESIIPQLQTLQQEFLPQLAAIPAEPVAEEVAPSTQGQNVTTYTYAWADSGSTPNFSYDLGSYKQSPQLVTFSFKANPYHDMIIGLRTNNVPEKVGSSSLSGDIIDDAPYTFELVLGGWDTPENVAGNTNRDQKSAIRIYKGTTEHGFVMFNDAKLPEPRGGDYTFEIDIQIIPAQSTTTITAKYKDPQTGALTTMFQATGTEINQVRSGFLPSLLAGTTYFEQIGFRAFSYGTKPFEYTVSEPKLSVPGAAIRISARTALAKGQALILPLDAAAAEIVTAAQALPPEAVNRATLIAQAQALRNNPTEGTLSLLNTIASYLEQLVIKESYTTEEITQGLNIASESYTITKPILESTELRTAINKNIASIKNAIAAAATQAQKDTALAEQIASYTNAYSALVESLKNDIATNTFTTSYEEKATALNELQAEIQAAVTALNSADIALSTTTQSSYDAYATLVTSGNVATTKTEWDTALKAQQDADAARIQAEEEAAAQKAAEEEAARLKAEEDAAAQQTTINQQREAEATVRTGNYEWFNVDIAPNTTQSLGAFQQKPQQFTATFTANPVHDMMIGLKIGSYTLELVVGGWDSPANVESNTNTGQQSAITIIEGTRDAARQKFAVALPEPRGAFFTFTLSVVQNRTNTDEWLITLAHEDQELLRITHTDIAALHAGIYEQMKSSLFEKIGLRTFTQGSKPFAFTVKNFTLAPSQEAVDAAKAAEIAAAQKAAEEEAARLKAEQEAAAQRAAEEEAAAQKAAEEEAARLKAEQEAAAQKAIITALETDAQAYVTQYNELIAALEKDIADKTFAIDFVAKATALNTMQEALDARVEELGDSLTPSTETTPSYMTYQTTIASNTVVTKKAEWDAALKAKQEAEIAAQKASDEYNAAVAKIETDAATYMTQYNELLAALKNDIATQTFETDFIAKATALNALQETIENNVEALGDAFAPTPESAPAYMEYDAATDGSAIVDTKAEWDTALKAKQAEETSQTTEVPAEPPTPIEETPTETPEQPAAQQTEEPTQEQPAATESSFAKGTFTPATALTNNSASFAVKSGMGVTIILTDSAGAQHRIGLSTKGTQLYPYGQTTPDGGLQASRVTLPNDLQEHPFVVRGDLSAINDDGESKYRLSFTVTATQANTDDVLSYDVPAPANPEQFALSSYQVTSDTGAFSFTAKEAPNALTTPSTVSTTATSMEQVQKAFDAYTQEPSQATKSKLSDTHQASLDDPAYRMSELRVKVVQALR